MRNSILILFITTLLTSFTLNAQDKKVALGLSLNPSLNWFKTNSSGLSANGNRFGFNYGLISDFAFGENYAFSTGLFINNGGGKVISKYKIDSLSYSIENDMKIQSVRIPLGLKMMTKEIGYFRYYGQFGFNLDYVINATTTTRVNGGPDESDVDIRGEITPLNLSLSLGLGFMYNLSGTTNFIVGVSFSNGFIDVFDEKSGNGEELKANANQIALNLGVLF